jgi:hypothetical protein
MCSASHGGELDVFDLFVVYVFLLVVTFFSQLHFFPFPRFIFTWPCRLAAEVMD